LATEHCIDAIAGAMRCRAYKEKLDMDTIGIEIGAALAVGLPALATGWAQSRIGPAAAASLAERPELGVTAILLIAIPETMAILGFVVAVLILMRGV
jgi:V/A-type H+-transporting ATPase subunit K